MRKELIVMRVSLLDLACAFGVLMISGVVAVMIVAKLMNGGI